MGNTAGSPVAAGGGSGNDQEGRSSLGAGRRSGAADPVAAALHDSWRLAYVVVGDVELASRAVAKAYLEASRGQSTSQPSRVELLEASLRISLTRAAENRSVETDSAVTTALWRLSPEQRAALWLTTVHQIDNATLGAVIGLTAANAAHIASRAKEWLDVALDHESGPLCEREVDLEDYVDGQLDDEERTAFEEHLPGCPTCRTRLRASKELGDLKTVLDAAVPEPPAGLTVETLEREEKASPDDGIASLAEPANRTPAVRPLAACCLALLIVAVIAVGVVRPRHSSSGPISTSDPRAILPNALSTSSGGAGSSVNLPAATGTTIVATTTSIPAVTFPTIPGRKSKP